MKKLFKNSGCFFAVTAICWCFLGVYASGAVLGIKERGFLKVSTNAEFEPFEYKDGDQFAGIDIDIAKKIAESLGVPIKINDVSFDAITLELANGNCDFAIAAMSYSEDKANSVDFSDPYYLAKQAVIVQSSSDIQSESDLSDKRIGVHLGTTGDRYCTEYFKNAKIERYNKSSDTVLDLINKRLDAVVIDEAPARKLLRISSNKAKILDNYLFEESYRIAVPKGKTELLEHINLVIRQMKNDGEIDKIVNKYITAGETPSVDVVAQFYNNLVYKNRYKMIINGLIATVKITAVALMIGIVIGLAVALVKVSRKNSFLFKILKSIANIYLTVIRGTPVIVQLFVIYYIVFSSTGLSKILIAMIAFGINSGAYVSEIIKSGILSVDSGQYEAGRSLGLSGRITMTKIILPQAFKNVLPTLVNEFIQLIKETSVAGFIGVTDLSRAGDIIKSQTYEPLVPLITVALTYLIMIMITTLFMSLLERRLRVSDKR